MQTIHIGNLDNDLYERQKRISWWDQDKISKAKVLIVGVGALGNEICKNLAQCGIGKMFIVDYDRIVKSNLNRCILFTHNDIGKEKAKVTAKRVMELFPDVKAEPIFERIEEIDESIYQNIDLAISGLDNIDVRLTLNAFCYYYNIPLVDGGTHGMRGMVQVVIPPSSACLQCRWRSLSADILSKKYSCAGEVMAVFEPKVPALSTSTSVIGGIQAREAIKILQNIDYYRKNKKWPEGIVVLENKYLYYDGERNIYDITNVSINPNCEIHKYRGKEICRKEL